MKLRAWLALGTLALCVSPAARALAQSKAAKASEPQSSLPDTTILALVDQRVIRADEYVRSYFDVMPDFRVNPDSAGRIEFLNTLIDKEVMGRVARSAGYQLSFENRLLMRQTRERLLSNMLFQRFVADTIHVSDAQVRRVYEQYGRELHLRQITFYDPESAEETRQKLIAGKTTWAQAAKANRIPEDARDAQGDVGWITRGNFDPSLGLEVFDLKPGGISAVVYDGLGYHLFQAVEERPGKKIAFEAARRVIADQLRDRSMSAGSRRLKDLVAQGLGVTLDSTNIRFAATHFKPARTNTQEQGVPNLDFDPNVPEFSAQDTAKVLVRFRDGRLTIGDWVHYYSEIPALMRPNVHTPSLLSNQLEGIVLEPYLAKEAEKRGLDKDSLTIAQLQKRSDQILVERMYADSISSKVHISKAQRRKYYDEHMSRYVTYPHARFAAIYAPNHKAADSLENRLKRGEKAEDILLADSLAGVKRGSIQERYENEGGAWQKALFEEMKSGAVSVEGPDAEGGYAVLQMLDYNSGRQLSFDEADRFVTENLTNIEEEKRLKQFLARHRRRYKVVSHPELTARVQLKYPASELDPETGSAQR